MLSPLLLGRALTSTERIAAEEAQVAAGAKGCGYRDAGCHGGLTCIRLVHDHYGDHYVTPDGTVHLPDTDIPEGAVFRPETRVPHVGRDRSGGLLQFSGPHQTAEQIAAAADQAKTDNATRTREFLASLDPDVLAEFVTPRQAASSLADVATDPAS